MKRRSIAAAFKDLGLSLFIKLPKAAFIYVSVLSLTAFFGDLHRYFELTSHFRLQYFLLSIGFLALFVILRTLRWAGVALICLVVNAGFIIPWYLPAQSVHAKHSGQKLSLLLCNVLYENENHAAVIELVKTERPDLAFFQEVTPRWAAALEGLKSEYPHAQVNPSGEAGGIAVFSRIPFVKAGVAPLPDHNGPAISIQINLGSRLVSILSVHTPPPMPKRNFEERADLLTRASDFVTTLPEPKILIGDLNTTMWSPYYKRLIERTGLINVREGFGLLPTWPTFLPVMNIPIDHCLVSRGIQVESLRTGSPVGSDHLPLIVHLLIPQN